jgi:hypothetical protein
MIHPETELRYVNDDLGYGVFATGQLPRGTIIWTLCRLDRRYTMDQIAAFAAPYQELLKKYCYLDSAGVHILCWDSGRYVNHSCEPTSFAVGPEIEILVRDVGPGEQITSDYSLGNLEADLTCRCGVPRCRGVIRAGDVQRFAEEWDQIARDSLPCAARVPQALEPFVEDKASFHTMVEDPAKMPSHRTLLLNRKVLARGA